VFSWLNRLFKSGNKQTLNKLQRPALLVPQDAERRAISLEDVGNNLLRMKAANPDLTEAEIAEKLGQTPSYVSRAIHAALKAPISN